MNASIDRFQKLLNENPDHELARFSLGKALYDAGSFSEARIHFERALARKPNWMMAQILIGKCDLALGDPVRAKAAFQRGLELAIAQNHEGPKSEMESLLAELP